jgi:hypothetical protein
MAGFWTTPVPYWDMETHDPKLYESLKSSDLVIFKVIYHSNIALYFTNTSIYLGRFEVGSSDTLRSLVTRLTSELFRSAIESTPTVFENLDH